MSRNKYIPLIIILLAASAGGFVRAHGVTSSLLPNAVHSAHSPKYKDAIIFARLHQKQFKRSRYGLDGLPAVPPLVTPYIVANTRFRTNGPHIRYSFQPTLSLRGPPAA